MLQDLHPKENKTAWDVLNETRVSRGLDPYHRPLARYEVVALGGLLVTIVALTLLST